MKVIRKKQPIFNRLSQNANISLRTASLLSDYKKEGKISVESIVVGILLNEECLATRVVEEIGVDRGMVLNKLSGGKVVEVTGDTSVVKELSFSKEGQEVLRLAFDLAQKKSHVYVGTEHLMLSILLSDSRVSKQLSKLGLGAESFRRMLSKISMYPLGVLAKPKEYMDSDREDSIMDFLGFDLVELAKASLLDPVVGRESEIGELMNVLSRRKKNNPLIVGESGVGKTSLVEGLAKRIAEGNVPHSLRGKRIISLDISAIVAGSRMRGDIEEKVQSIVNEVISRDDTILFIDDIHGIVSSGPMSGNPDIASVLKPSLLKEGFRCIGATTTDEYNSYLQEDNALARRFQPIFLEEPSVEDSIAILLKTRNILERHHNIEISKEALKSAVMLSNRYVMDRFLPDKAIDIIDEACASKKLLVEGKYNDIANLLEERNKILVKKENAISQGDMEEALELQKKETLLGKRIKRREAACLRNKQDPLNRVGVEDVRDVVSKWTGIPLNTLGTRERESLISLEDSLKGKVVGQEEACSLVASAIKRARTGIIDIDRPWASFLFLGPTGVGKTELAKVLTRELFGDDDRLIQIDMSEMMEMHSVSKLIGSPPGYIGFQEGGWLTEKVRRNPHAVILFDEIEKAHPDVLNVLLQILEYGHLTDGRGRKVNFKNTVIVLTSNIGAEEIGKDKVLGFGGKGMKGRSDVDIDGAYESMKVILLDELRGTLRPELLNRIDDVVIFRSLNRKDARKIVLLLLEDLNRRLKEERIQVSLDNRALNYIVKHSFNEEYGARPLRRFLQDRVENILAEYLLRNEEKKGKDINIIKIGVVGGKIEILD